MAEKLVEAYCTKCRTKRTMQEPHPVQLKNGKPAVSGRCPVCGTNLFRFGAG